MARPNKGRSIGGEANLAQRIAREREQRGLSYEALATLMTEAGCSIQGSAIYKIEKADPPRRITVDELIALAEVFKLSIDDLLTPVEVLANQRAQELLREMDQADKAWLEGIVRWVEVHAEYLQLAKTSPELDGYVQLKTPATADGQVVIWEVKSSPNYDPAPFNEALAMAYNRMLKEAEQIADSSANEHGEASSGGKH